MRWPNLEIKSLQVLHYLLHYRNAKLVAEKLNMNRASVTYHLNKLRQQLDDPLFIATGKKFEATARALEMASQLEETLEQLEQLLQPAKFVPHRASGVVKIALQDVTAAALIPKLVKQLQLEAPHVEIEVWDWDLETERKVVDGEVDIAINVLSHQNPLIHGRQLTESVLNVVMDKSHPLANQEFDTQEIFDFDHALLLPAGPGQKPLDQLAHKLGKKRRVKVSATSYTVLAEAIQGSQILTVISHLAFECLKQTTLIAKPIEELPQVPIYCYWHKRNQHAPLHSYVRGLLINLFQEQLAH